eukprot:17845-Heterococcus_DN1.PRE.11
MPRRRKRQTSAEVSRLKRQIMRHAYDAAQEEEQDARDHDEHDAETAAARTAAANAARARARELYSTCCAWVGGIKYAATAPELEAYFTDCLSRATPVPPREPGQAWVRAIDHRRSKGHAYVVFASPECKLYLQDRARQRLLWFQGLKLRVDEPRGIVTKSLAAALAVGSTEALQCRQLQLCTQWPHEQPTQHDDLLHAASLFVSLIKGAGFTKRFRADINFSQLAGRKGAEWVRSVDQHGNQCIALAATHQSDPALEKLWQRAHAARLCYSSSLPYALQGVSLHALPEQQNNDEAASDSSTAVSSVSLQLPSEVLGMPWIVQLALLCVLSTFKLDILGVTQQLVDAISSAVAEHSAVTAAAAIAKMCAYSEYTRPCTGEMQLRDVLY